MLNNDFKKNASLVFTFRILLSLTVIGNFLSAFLKSVYNQELSFENLPQFVLGTISKLFVLFVSSQRYVNHDFLYII